MTDSTLDQRAAEGARFSLTRLPSAAIARSDALADLADAVDHRPVELPPRLLYDAVGSRLFEAITHLDEYYPTRAETEILEREAPELVARARPDELFEIGSGSSRKTRLLIEAALATGCRRYRAFDVSEAALREAGAALTADFPELEVEALVGDFHTDLARVPRRGRRLVLFLGSTIGNMERAERARLLASVARSMRHDDALLLGYDLRKDTRVLEAAYDDPAGLTAAFVRNGLRTFARVVGADIPLGAFKYEAVWVSPPGRMEMRLVAREPVHVDLPRLGRTLDLAPGEHLLSEISTKFTREGLKAELAAAGLVVERVSSDAQRRFELAFVRRRPADA